MLDDWTAQNVTVMGLGRFGGGAGVARWLAGKGAHVLLTDLASQDSLAAVIGDLRDLVTNGAIELRLGEHRIHDFTSADCVIANPAVPRPWQNPYLRAAADAGVPITTEIRLLIEHLDRSRVIGVTGSAGKSTTAAMIHHLLLASNERSHLGGNIGGSLLNDLAKISPDDWIVLELSSAMLYWLGQGVGWRDAPGISPHAAAHTNLTPNHLDWHGSFEHYSDSKHNIARYQQRPRDFFLGSDDESDECEPLPLRIPGEHNQHNARLAIRMVASLINANARSLESALRTFSGLPHRLQLVAEREGIRYYNDSKSTTPDATLRAIDAFDNPAAIHLIAGGYDKHLDLGPIAQLTSRIGGLYTIGATGAALAREAGNQPNVQFCETLEQAVSKARSRMRTGDILLLSPGCASWDQFENFERRGELFARLVQQSASLPIPVGSQLESKPEPQLRCQN